MADEDFSMISESNFDCLNDEERRLILGYYNSDDKDEFAKMENMTIGALYTKIHKIRKTCEE